MKEPVAVTYNDQTYVRWDWRVWTDDGSAHPHGLRQRVNDWALVTQLEKHYSDQQRASAKSPRPPVADLDQRHLTPNAARVERRPKQRESRGNGRVE